MKSIHIIALLLVSTAFNTQAQQKTTSSSQSRTIEINNLNGELSISIEDGEITDFEINGEPVSKDEYDNFQNLIDQFGEDIEVNITPPTPPIIENDKNTLLRQEVIQYLMDEDIINSATRYTVKLERKYMKVDGKKTSDLVHHKCMEIFREVYGHRLNFDSKVIFQRKGDKSKSSISIVE